MVTNEEAETAVQQLLAMIGASFVDLVMKVDMVGHRRPQNSLCYVGGAEDTFALDFTKWCAQGGEWEAARDRCLESARLVSVAAAELAKAAE